MLTHQLKSCYHHYSYFLIWMILLSIRRKLIGILGEHTNRIKDRAYTREEIKKIIDASDLKYKVQVSLMVLPVAE